ncbi:hypothetical protein RM697_03355 [Ichthyenterobacterium sp. W332]|uniref:STAS/SEC14 domain-containing protein n=1 Tax=Microcosmobacter mediterraneus TaxID=3075607 RepID=A0ABU2YIF4_9FLAO|nr:hypothetical protein [Ichthyenterobacterium sp. W332]MDT0557666.1 hypothetical protein [Ichthyenterobacterium sp. W332]
MKFEDSPLSIKFNFKKVVLSFGSIYMTNEDFFVMEVNEGVHFNSEKLNELLATVRLNYGDSKKLAYIANRINAYSIDPILWSYFDKDDSILVAASIVSYRDSTYLNANIEKQMAAIPLKRSHSLNEAVDWVGKLAEFN